MNYQSPRSVKEAVDLLAILLAEYAGTRNWRAELPPNNHLHVSVKKIEPPATETEMLGKDYELFEALNLLKALNVLDKKQDVLAKNQG